MKTEGVINYTGSKSKLIEPLNDLFKHSKAVRLVDCCAGGLSVALHSNFDNVLANDISPVLPKLYALIVENGLESTIDTITNEISLNGLGKEKTNHTAYTNYRTGTNQLIQQCGYDQFTLMRILVLQYHSFSNIIRLNSDGEFNAPFGQRTFNRNSQRKLQDFYRILGEKEIEFSNKSFLELDIQKDDLVYIDPPYLITDAVYNHGWNRESDNKMIAWLDELDNRGIEFVMSNVTHHRGKTNDRLIDWASRYNVHSRDYKYVFNTHQAKEQHEATVEVMITNFK